MNDAVAGETLWPDARPWPTLSPDALYGLAGDIVRIISPLSEADSAALLAHILVSFGAFIGPQPHFEVENTQQPARLFVLVLGDTSNGRKGTARNRVQHVFRIADEQTLDKIRASGLSSGEGLIEHLSDKQNESGELVSTEKRALVHDAEFARVLAVATRDGNTLSMIVRDFWETGDVGNMTRKNPLKVRGAHVCLTADITPDEFTAKMPSLEIANGLLNRFLIVCSKRSQTLPFGGDIAEAKLTQVATRLREAAKAARNRARLEMTQEAKEIWAPWYCYTTNVGGILGAATGRREAQVLRLALTYALLDCADAIDVPHLRAAIAFWNYCFASARYVFGSRLGDPVADRLLRVLRDEFPKGLDGREIDERMGKSLRPGQLDVARDGLESRGLISHEKELTGGRPRIRWKAVPMTDKGGRSLQEIAQREVCPLDPVCPASRNGERPETAESSRSANDRIRPIDDSPTQTKLDL